MVAARKKNSCF